MTYGSPGAAAMALLLRDAGVITARATGAAQPASGPEGGLAVLLNAGDPSAALQAPDLYPVAYWITASVLLIAVLAGGAWLWRVLGNIGHSPKGGFVRTARNCHASQRAAGGLQDRADAPGSASASIAPRREGDGRWLPTWRISPGQRRGLDARDRVPAHP